MTASPLGWIVTNWRLKLLSVVLAVGLLGGVAFSENPPTLDTVAVHVDYRNLPQGLVIVNPRTSVDVPVAGFRDDVQRYRQTAQGVSIDLTHAHAGPSQTVLAQPRSDVSGLTFRQSTIPISLTLERLDTRLLDIEVRATKKSAGILLVPDRTYATCGNASYHCQVSVTGPASLLAKLKAYVNYDVPLTSAATGSSPDQPILFEENGKPVNLDKDYATDPQVKWTPEVVTVQVTTEGGSQSKVVPVLPRVLGTQACGYQISNVEVSPTQVTVNGPEDAVSRITSVGLDFPIVLNGLSSSQHFTRNVVTGSTTVNVAPQTVTINVSLNQAFSCTAPSPTTGVPPAAAPTPTPSPSATPRPTPS